MAVTIPIVSEFNGKGISKAIKQFEQLEGAGAKANFALQKAALPAAAAVAGLGYALFGATQSAMEDQAAQVELARTLSISTSATDAQIKANEDLISKMSMASGIADDDLRPALASLARGTKDMGKAQEGLSLAMDISTATGKGLAEVSDALAKAYGGNMKGLKALSPEMAALIKDGADLSTVMDVLGGTFGGATEAAANTAEGGMKRLGIALAETKESIGAALIPVIEKLLPYLITFGTWAQSHTGVLLAIAAAIGVIAGAILLYNVAIGVATTVNTLFALSMTAAQIATVGFATLGIAVLIAALVALYLKFDFVKTAVDAIFKAMLVSGKFLVDMLVSYFSGLYSAFKTVFNGIAALWNNTIGKLSFTFPDWVPGLGGKGFSVPKIPILDQGGIVSKPTLAMLSANSQPEAIVPLNKLGAMGGVTVNINGGFSTSAEIGQAVVNSLRAFSRQNGPAQLQIGSYQ
jgi:hypothetical protein